MNHYYSPARVGYEL